jgi:prophage antirepressor-like protein
MFRYEHDNQLDQVRTVEVNGEIWFVATDVATVLGYKKPLNAVAAHCRERGTLKQGIPTKSGVQNMVLINEPNVYRLIVKSQLPSAEQFEQWLFEEVIPSIRKTGGYGIDRRKTSNFVLRYFKNFDKVKQGTFSVITELYVRLYGRLEHAGYVVPDKGLTGKEIRPDISVGKCFANYLRENYPSAPQEFESYIHTFESGVEVPARLYPIDLISIFIRYVDEVWIPKNAETYFKDRDRKALDYLPKLLPAY